MIYAIGFDGPIATRTGKSLAWTQGAQAGLKALLEAEHDVIVWTARMGPSASAEDRAEMEAFLAPMLAAHDNLRIATAERDGPKPIADVYLDEKCERFASRSYPGAGVGWTTLAMSARRRA